MSVIGTRSILLNQSYFSCALEEDYSQSLHSCIEVVQNNFIKNELCGTRILDVLWSFVSTTDMMIQSYHVRFSIIPYSCMSHMSNVWYLVITVKKVYKFCNVNAEFGGLHMICSPESYIL
jgi:hypothetical protein